MTATPTYIYSLQSEGGGPELVRLHPGTSVTVGRDAGNKAQLGHGSVEPFHARLRCDDWGVWIAPVGDAPVAINGEKTREERLVPLDAVVEIGALRFKLPRHERIDLDDAREPVWPSLVTAAVSLVLSAGLHGGAMWLAGRLDLGLLPSTDESLPFELEVQARSMPIESLALPADPLTPPPAPKLPEIAYEPVPVPELEPPIDTASVPAPSFEDSFSRGLDGLDGPLTIGVGGSSGRVGSGGSGHGGGGMIGSGTLDLHTASGVGSGLISRVSALRGCGVDLVFVVDTTSSMRPFLHGAREAAGTLVATLATIVQDLRVGVVAYRDTGDTYVSKSLPLGANRYALLNFLWTLRAEGGGDVPESVASGLQAAIEDPGWRPRAHHVIVVIGDAPPHQQEWTPIKSLVRKFSKSDAIPGAVISTIYTGEQRPNGANQNQNEDGAAAMAELARLGHGDYLELGGFACVGERLLLLTLGPKHASEIDRLLACVHDGPKEQLIKKHVAARDTEWLLSKLRRPPVHPGIVDGLVALADQNVLLEARRILLEQPPAPRESCEAALYLIMRAVPAAEELDLDQVLNDPRGLLKRLDALISRR